MKLYIELTVVDGINRLYSSIDPDGAEPTAEEMKYAMEHNYLVCSIKVEDRNGKMQSLGLKSRDFRKDDPIALQSEQFDMMCRATFLGQRRIWDGETK